MPPTKGLIFIKNEFSNKGNGFVHTKMYRFIPSFGRPLKTIIELDIYENNICVLSFYDKSNGTKKNKYRLRSNIGGGHVKAIFQACLEAYFKLDQDYALIFAASNDVGDIREDNSRYSAYLLFLSYYFKNYDEYDKQGSIALNTYMLYHRSFQYKAEAELFYKDFEKELRLIPLIWIVNMTNDIYL